jgi:hypothetical protein
MVTPLSPAEKAGNLHGTDAIAAAAPRMFSNSQGANSEADEQISSRPAQTHADLQAMH